MQPPVFMKGFIKSYAEFLGLDSAAVLERYRDIPAEKRGEVKTEESKPEPGQNYSRYAIPGIIIISLVVFIIMTRFFRDEGDVPPITVKPVQQTQTERQEPAMTNTTAHGIFTTTPKKIFQPLITPKAVAVAPARPGAQTAPIPGRPEKKYTLLITARELTWLRITMDSKEPLEVLMRKGEITTWSADRKLIILSGNAGGVELTLNGKPMESMGLPGKVVTKLIPE